MQTLYFGSFVDTIYPFSADSLKASGAITDDTSFVEYLLSAADNGEALLAQENKTRRSIVSRFRSGERQISQSIAAPFFQKNARENVTIYMEDCFVHSIVKGKIDELINKLVYLISKDTTIDEDFKVQLLENAHRETLSVFISDILIYTVTTSSFNTDRQLKKLGSTALTVLIDEAVPMVVKSCCAILFPDIKSTPEAIDFLRKNDFESFFKSLYDNRMIAPYDYIKWQRRRLPILEQAQKYLRNDSDQSEIAIEFNADWILDFLELAGSISDENLQWIWARILAGEILRPGVVSPSTLLVMLNFSPQDAELLIQLSTKTYAEFGYNNPPLLFVSDFTPDSDGRNISLAGTRPLIEAGILSSPETITVKGMLGFIDREKYAVVIHSRENRPYSFSFTREVLTRAGRELVASLGSNKAKGIEDEAVRLCHRLSEDYTVKIHRVRFNNNLWVFYTSAVEEHEFSFHESFPDLTDYFEIKSALNQLTDCCSEFQNLYLERIEKQYKVSPQDIQHFIKYLPKGLKKVSPSIVELYVKLFTDHPEHAQYILSDADLPYFVYKSEEYRDYCIKMLDSIPSYQEITHFLKRVEEHEKKYPYSFHGRRKSYGVPFLDI